MQDTKKNTDLKTILLDYRKKFQDIADFASMADFGTYFAGIFDGKITDVLTASTNSSIDLIDFLLENEGVDLLELRKELQGTYDYISNAKSLCFDEKTRKDILGRLGSKLNLMDYLIEENGCAEAAEDQKPKAEDFWESAYDFLRETYRKADELTEHAGNPTCSSTVAEKWKLLIAFRLSAFETIEKWNKIEPSENDLKYNL